MPIKPAEVDFEVKLDERLEALVDGVLQERWSAKCLRSGKVISAKRETLGYDLVLEIKEAYSAAGWLVSIERIEDVVGQPPSDYWIRIQRPTSTLV